MNVFGQYEEITGKIITGDAKSYDKLNFWSNRQWELSSYTAAMVNELQYASIIN